MASTPGLSWSLERGETEEGKKHTQLHLKNFAAQVRRLDTGRRAVSILTCNKDAELEITIRVKSTASNADLDEDDGMYDDMVKAVERLKKKQATRWAVLTSAFSSPV